mmetsp:Transcript_40697/g.116034  ORF Transcript_40697/g.116034 Transcript_40697/m.116034 type:complete len:401 (-) Transcript_40697:62-1264(-)
MKGVPKTLTFNHRFTLGADFSRQLTDRSGPNHFTLPDLLTWAPGVACNIEWSPRTDNRELGRDKVKDGIMDTVIDCSTEVPEAPPAPHGVTAETVKKVTSTCKKVALSCGGSPLHGTWGALLSFPEATHLAVEAEDLYQPAPASKMVNSIPEFLLETTEAPEEGNSRCLPSIEHVHAQVVRSHSNGHEGLPSGAATRELEGLMGSLKRVREASFFVSALSDLSRCISYFSGLHHPLDKLEVKIDDMTADMLADAAHECEAGLSYPQVKSLSVDVGGARLKKDHVRNLLSLILSIRPTRVSLTVDMSTDDLVGDVDSDEEGMGAHNYGWYGPEHPEPALAAFCVECVARVGGTYEVLGSDHKVNADGVNTSTLMLELELKDSTRKGRSKAKARPKKANRKD